MSLRWARPSSSRISPVDGSEDQSEQKGEYGEKGDIPIDLAFNFSPLTLHSLIQLSGEPTAINDESCENSTDDTLGCQSCPYEKGSTRWSELTPLPHRTS